MASKNKKVGIIVQARFGSTRFPGKVLHPYKGKPILAYLIERLQRCQLADDLILATTDQHPDDQIAKFCDNFPVPYFRGSEQDVLDRYYRAARQANLDIIVRITGDCPVMDPRLIDEMLAYFLSSDLDYLSNTLTPTYPDGLDIEIFTQKSLAIAHKHAMLESEREHVTPYIKKNPDQFSQKNWIYERDLSAWRLTLDEPADWTVIQLIYDRLYDKFHIFSLKEMEHLIDADPSLIKGNAHIGRDEGYQKSLDRDSMTTSRRTA